MRHLWGANSAGVLWLALFALITDQACKLYLLNVFDISANGPVDLLPFMELVMVWNRGISYGLFQQHAETGRIALTVLSFLAALALWIWSARMDQKFPAVCLGLLIGGALGNGIDRAAYGAVADFFHFHIGSFSWYVFNIADVWIVAGVAGLLYDSFFNSPNTAAK
ncbi:MAG: signal peptidase II [Stappiaceae bacterium]